MQNGIPPGGGGGGGGFIPPLVRGWSLEGNLLSNPLPPFFGQVNEEGSDLWPPPTSMVETKAIKFSKSNLYSVLLLPLVSLFTLTRVIQPLKAVGGGAFLVFSLSSVKDYMCFEDSRGDVY